MNNLEIINRTLNESNADAWIVVDYENKNHILVSFLGRKMLTRKVIAVFPRNKRPFIICHSIDTIFLNTEDITKTFDLKVYKSWQEMLDIQKKEFKYFKMVLMDISENGLVPSISLADYGSVQFVKDLGIKVVSSGDLLQRFSAVLSEESMNLQSSAYMTNYNIMMEAFREIGKAILQGKEIDEYTVQQYICKRYESEGLIYDEPPIVAIGKNASSPHYTPTKEVSSKIKRGDLVLIDAWAKFNKPEAAYSDITLMGVVSETVPKVYKERFDVLREAIEASFAFISKGWSEKRTIHGYEIDDVARGVVSKAGYGDYFIHRTGHSIADGVSPHGPGVNIDNYESHDTRSIIENVSFSLEPGIYAPDFGMRSETDIVIKNGSPMYVGDHQKEIFPILKIK